jgi:hypothetical protein
MVESKLKIGGRLSYNNTAGAHDNNKKPLPGKCQKRFLNYMPILIFPDL